MEGTYLFLLNIYLKRNLAVFLFDHFGFWRLKDCGWNQYLKNSQKDTPHLKKTIPSDLHISTNRLSTNWQSIGNFGEANRGYIILKQIVTIKIRLFYDLLSLTVGWSSVVRRYRTFLIKNKVSPYI